MVSVKNIHDWEGFMVYSVPKLGDKWPDFKNLLGVVTKVYNLITTLLPILCSCLPFTSGLDAEKYY